MALNLWLLEKSSTGYGEVATVLIVAESEDAARLAALKAFRSESDATAFVFEDESVARNIGTADGCFDRGHIVTFSRSAE